MTRGWNTLLPTLLLALLFARATRAEDPFSLLIEDQLAFYSPQRGIRLGLAFAGGGALANSGIDESLQNGYQDHIRGSGTDRLAKTAKLFGEGRYVIPLSFALAGLAYWDEDSSVGRYGAYTARSYLTGVAPLLAMQRVTGAGRPDEHECGAQWRPFADSNGVSGHAFVGAVPFLVLAHMNEDRPLLRYAALAASLATPWSRLNDNDHYASQIALGWYMAYEAVGAVFDAQKNRQRRYSLVPMVGPKSFALMLTGEW